MFKMVKNPDYADDGSLDRDQFKARSLYRRSQQRLHKIHDALMISPVASREKLHAALDRRLDEIAATEAKAREIDPLVTKRLTLAEGSISW